MNPKLVAVLAWGVLAAALLYFAMSYFSNNNLELGERSARLDVTPDAYSASG